MGAGHRPVRPKIEDSRPGDRAVPEDRELAAARAPRPQCRPRHCERAAELRHIQDGRNMGRKSISISYFCILIGQN